ncbi:MAG: pectin acetylesterase-family hydrolase [Polyangiaceae bacterium]
MTTFASRVAFFGACASFGAALLLGSVACDDTSGTGGSGTTSSNASSTSMSSTGSGTIDVPDNTWTFVDFPDSRCMDDSPTGIAVNFTSKSNDLFIFLEGGNACFNFASCKITAHEKTGFGQAQFDLEKDAIAGWPLFARTDAANPTKDFNYVYVPYCTGDVHGGDASGVMVGNKARNFHGYKNLDQFLDKLVATFPQAGKIILSGFSAGGFGAAYNYDHVAKKFPNNKVILIDDSGPPMAEAYVAPCLQKYLFDLWGLKNTVPAGCTDCAPASGIFMEPLAKYLATTYSDRSLALVSSTEDKTISSFWAFGVDNCKDLMGTGGAYDPADYAAGLADLRDRIAGSDPNFFTYYIDGTDMSDKTRHVWLDAYKGVSSNGVLLEDWLVNLIGGDPDLVSVPPKMTP